jgi:RNA polymerase sigma factor (sigma-70 family)
VEPDDDDLIRRAQRGEGDAYAVLVRRHQGLAFRTAYAVCGDAAEAEDATQEAFVKAYRALGRFRVGSAWRPWLLRIVANEARNRRRAEGRRRHLVVQAGHAGGGSGEAPAPDVTALLHEQRSALAQALARLEPPHREVVVLRHLLDLSEAECAAVLDVPRGTVKSRLARALDKLREDLGER